MTAVQEIRERAELFKWSVHPDARVDLFVRGDHAVQVSYTLAGSVHSGELYRFFSLEDMHLLSRTPDTDRKLTVLSWLAA